jgi:hypothetical protein
VRQGTRAPSVDMLAPRNQLRALFVVLALALGTIANSAEPLDELAEREAIKASISTAFGLGDFAKLETTWNGYWSTKGRSPSGLWKLTHWYSGIQYLIDMYSVYPDPEQGYRELESKVDAWLARYPESPSAHIVLSMIYVSHAWKYRGGEYASAVDPAAWAPFHRYIELARKNLAAHKKVSSVDPHWYEWMLLIAKVEGWERKKFDVLLDEALDREPLFHETYFAALEYLLPKWHGSRTEIETFAREAVARTRQVEGEGMYARIYWVASNAEFENDLFTKAQVSWPRMRLGFDDIIARYPDNWNLNTYAKFACLAKDKQKTREIMARMKGAPVVFAWQPEPLWETCSKWALAK